jgi:VWFA-related protein
MNVGDPRSPRHGAPRPLLLPALLAAALGLPAPAAPAQGPAPAQRPSAPAAQAPAAGAAEETFYESVDVDVVNVEVVATDRAGRPVAGLAKEEFELYEDGKPVAVTNFFASSGQAAPVGAALQPTSAGAPGTAAPDRARPAKPADQSLSFAVFVDNENLTPNARRPVLGALQEFLHAHAGAGDHVILASYDGGLRVSQPAASDPAAIDAAVRKMMTAVTHGSLAVERQSELRRLQQDLAEGAGPDAAVEFSSLDSDLQVEGSIDADRGRRGLAALADFISSLAGLPGRKALVVVTGAFAQQADPLLARIAEHANANRVTIYILGAVEPGAAGQFRDPTALGNDLQGAADALAGGLHSVADRTGGLTAVERIDPRTFLEQIRGDVETYYSLGFTPGHTRDGKLHKLAVKLKGRGDLALRYRDRYEDRSGAQRAAAETLSALVLGGGDNPLGVEISFEPAKPAAGKKGTAVLPVVVQVPLAKLVLLPQERFHEGKLTLFVATRDERGRVSTLRRLDAPVHVANERLMGSLGQSVAYRVEVPLRPGEKAVAVGVRDEVGHVDSTAWSALGTVPAAH